MVQLRIVSGKMAGAESVVRHFPFRIGRSPSANFRIEDTGVWDDHLTLCLAAGHSIEMNVHAGALATINGEAAAATPLRNGDVIGLGAVRLQFALSPASQKTLVAREIFFWLGLSAVCLLQVRLIYWLLN